MQISPRSPVLDLVVISAKSEIYGLDGAETTE